MINHTELDVRVMNHTRRISEANRVGWHSRTAQDERLPRSETLVAALRARFARLNVVRAGALPARG
jgi:hypothetical protein